MVQPLPNEMMAETEDVGNQCVTIVTDAISCDPQMLGQRTDETDPDDSGNHQMLQKKITICFHIVLKWKVAHTISYS